MYKQQPLREAELWLQQTSGLVPAVNRSWDALVSSLLELEPLIDGGSLQFQPVLLALPRGVQVSLLALLHLHHHSISTASLQRLLKETEPYLEHGTWLKALHSLTSGFVVKERTWTSVTDINHGDSSSPVNHGYTFSQRNAAAASHLCQSLKSVVGSPWRHHVSSWAEEAGMPDGNKSPEDAEMTGIIVIEDDSERDDSLLSHSGAGGDGETVAATPDALLPQGSAADPPPQPSQPGERRDSQAMDNLCPMAAAARRLREHWLGMEPGTQPPPEIQIFLTHSPQQVETLLRKLQPRDLPDTAWSQMCKDVLALSPAISYSILVLFFSHTVVPQFVELNQAAPRVLLTCLTNMAQMFPRQLIDAICSGLKGRELNASQVDLLTLLGKEKFTPENQLHLLQQLVTSEIRFSEQTACLLQGLLPQQGELSPGTVTALLSCLAAAAPTMAKSMQFGKLLLLLVSRLGKQLTGTHQSMLQHCLDCHKTFMKKSVTGVLKRLSQ